MSNILNHNRMPFDFGVSKSDYWDTHLYLPQGGGNLKDGLQDDCLSAYIETTINDCIVPIENVNNLASLSQYKWVDSVNKGLMLNNIGFTGVDNGLLTFDKDTITEEEFNEIYTKSVLEVEADDYRLMLSPVDGNTKVYDYPYDFVTDKDGNNVAKLDGGFFQGFFQSGDGCEYKVLPTKLGNGWTMEFVIKPEDCEDSEYNTLNKKYPENSGIFFYIGTRAENKWWRYYNTDEEAPDIVMSDGIPLDDEKQYVTTDNKFLTYNRTKSGLKANKNKDGKEILIAKYKPEPLQNYFLVMNRAEGGYTAKTISEIETTEREEYNILADLFRNALAFKVNEDGSVGYKFMVKDCESENGYAIKEERSYPGMVIKDEWNLITVRVMPVVKFGTEAYNYDSSLDYMRLAFYVNGKLVLWSKMMPTLLLRALNDNETKQEAVPYNISLGGGTQGLCDVVYDKDAQPGELLFLEKEFGGSFCGYFKTFRFHTCDMDYQKILANYVFENINGKSPVDPDTLNIYYGAFNMFDDNPGMLPSQIPLVNSQILELPKIEGTKKNFNLPIPVGVNRIVIAYPVAFGPIQEVIDMKCLGFNIVVSFKVEIRKLYADNRFEEYFVYRLDYAFLNNIENIYKVKIK